MFSYWDRNPLVVVKINFPLALSSTDYSLNFTVLVPMSNIDSLKFIWTFFPKSDFHSYILIIITNVCSEWQVCTSWSSIRGYSLT